MGYPTSTDLKFSYYFTFFMPVLVKFHVEIRFSIEFIGNSKLLMTSCPPSSASCYLHLVISYTKCHWFVRQTILIRVVKYADAFDMKRFIWKLLCFLSFAIEIENKFRDAFVGSMFPCTVHVSFKFIEVTKQAIFERDDRWMCSFLLKSHDLYCFGLYAFNVFFFLYQM